MIVLNNFRIVQLDDYNMTFEEYREVENSKTGEVVKKWKRTGGYYSNLKQCLKALKDYLIAQKLQEDKEHTVEEIIKFIDELNESYVNCNLNVARN